MKGSCLCACRKAKLAVKESKRTLRDFDLDFLRLPKEAATPLSCMCKCFLRASVEGNDE